MQQFKVGDFVVHPAYGIGHIVTIKERQFSQKSAPRLYYKITMPKNHHIIWTPVEVPAANGLRLVTAKSDLDQYRNLLKSASVPLDTDQPKRRHLELASRLKQGSFRVMCEVVRDLTALGEQKPLGPADRATLQKTLEKLSQEWATAADISIIEALKEINSLLKVAQEEALE